MTKTNKPKPQSMRHKWDHDNEKRLAACESTDGNARNARPCLNCGLIKVTVITSEFPPKYWHEWHTSDGQIWIGEATPPCLTVPKVVRDILREVA